MAKAADAMTPPDDTNEQETETPPIDSKYRLILVAAQRSKQLQRGARPRVEMDTQRHKPTRVALEEVLRGKVVFNLVDKE
jgi:DNA-directed RNA polymerase omega subunit